MLLFIQGLMFGYATDETEECMPLTVVLAHKLNQKIADLRRNGEFWWARPDSKTQVTLLSINYQMYYEQHHHHTSCRTSTAEHKPPPYE